MFFKNRRSEDGASAVEFAILLPVLMLILFGIIEFGLLLYNKQMITNAAREGARAGIVAATPRVSDAEVTTIVNSYCATHMINFGPGTPVVNVARTGSSFGDDLTVTVSFQYTFLVLSVLPQTLFGPLTIQSQAVMKME